MKLIHYLAPIIIGMLLVAGCSEKDDSSPTSSNTPGTLRLLITDAPAQYDEVFVSFSEVSVHFEDQWITVSDSVQTYDLLELSNSITAVLGTKTLSPGNYGQIRLKTIDDSTRVVIGGESFPLKVPSGSSSGLKLGGGFEIVSGVTTELVLDFDAARSIHEKGHKEEFTMNPVIRIVATLQSGSISGHVTNVENAPVAYAIAGTDSMTTFVDMTNGDFILGFLPPATYNVTVTDSLDRSFSTDNITVTIGQSEDIGDITLQ